jgi:carbonic anhydrase
VALVHRLARPLCGNLKAISSTPSALFKYPKKPDSWGKVTDVFAIGKRQGEEKSPISREVY